jgi:hypothetical protein
MKARFSVDPGKAVHRWNPFCKKLSMKAPVVTDNHPPITDTDHPASADDHLDAQLVTAGEIGPRLGESSSVLS